MISYCVNRNGDHEVHKRTTCSYCPDAANREDFLAENDVAAMKKARSIYTNADGCAYCMSAFHTR